MAVGLWSIQPPTEISSNIFEISQRHGLLGSSTVDRKLDLLVGELKNYGAFHKFFTQCI